MNETVTDIIVARSQHADRLATMLVWSIAAHVAVTALVLLLPEPTVEPPPRVMTISLGGAPGPRTGGMTQMGGRPVQAPPPEEPVKPVETPPAPKPPAMTLPDPKAKPTPKPERAPKEATGRTPTTGAQPEDGSTRAETQVRGQGFSGLSTAGGAGGGSVTVDAADFCCPEYISDIVNRIQLNWRPRQGIVGITTIKFTIGRDGTVTAMETERSSGFDVLDFQAQRALLSTRRLPVLPSQYTNSTLTVHLEFVYQR